MAFLLFPMENFPSEIFGVVFSALFVLILVIELRILLRDRKGEGDRGSLGAILLGVFFPLVVMVGLSFTEIGRINVNFGYLGLLFLSGGFALRQYSIFVLGKFFVPVVGKQKGQRIIQRGPYRLVRHPSYTGLLLELLGAALCFSNWISFVVVLIAFIPAISYRINVEEEFLRKNFKEYEGYQERTRKLIPLIY